MWKISLSVLCKTSKTLRAAGRQAFTYPACDLLVFCRIREGAVEAVDVVESAGSSSEILLPEVLQLVQQEGEHADPFQIRVREGAPVPMPLLRQTGQKIVQHLQAYQNVSPG